MQKAAVIQKDRKRAAVRDKARQECARIPVRMTRATAERLSECRQEFRDEIGVKPTTYEAIGLLLARTLDGKEAGQFKPVNATGPEGFDAWLRSALDWHDAAASRTTPGDWFRAERDHVLRLHGLPRVSRRSKSVLSIAMDLAIADLKRPRPRLVVSPPCGPDGRLAVEAVASGAGKG